MPLRRMFNMLSAFSQGDNPQTIRNDLSVGSGPINRRLASPGIRTGRVMAVGGRVVVQHAGRIEYAAQTTDEPLRAGQPVWLSPIRGGGVVVHGSRK